MSNPAAAVAVWFEIPVVDLARATAFYEALFTVSLKTETIAGMDMAVFPYEAPAVAGALVAAPSLKPSPDGVVVYLSCRGRMDAMLAAVEKLGGGLVMGVSELPRGMGRIAFIADSEGNRIGLHDA